MARPRRYVHEVQGKDDEGETWQTIFRYKTYYLRDDEPFPKEVDSLDLVKLDYVYIREVLVAKDDAGNPIVRVIRDYPPINDEGKAAPAVTYAICLFEGCGAKIVPAQADNHLRRQHGVRLRNLGKQPKIPLEYFKVIVEHGRKAEEGKREYWKS